MTNEQLAAFYLGMVELAQLAKPTTVDCRWHLENARDHLATARDPSGLFDRDATQTAITHFVRDAII